MLHLTDDNFEQEVVNSSLPVLVDFWAPWCGPCQMIASIIEELAIEFEGIIKIGKCNIEENPKIAAHFGIQSIPTLKIFKDGEVIETIIGAMPKEKIVAKLKESILNPE